MSSVNQNSKVRKNTDKDMLNLLKNEVPSKKVDRLKRAIRTANTNFYNRNKLSPDAYNVRQINDIVYNEKAFIVANFKDFLIYDDSSEFLKRFYKFKESEERLPRLYDYYENYSKIFPNYIILPEAKFIYKNIQKKQRLIDTQQMLEEGINKKKDDSSYLFNTRIHESIMNVSMSFCFGEMKFDEENKGIVLPHLISIKNPSGLEISFEGLIDYVSATEKIEKPVEKHIQSNLNTIVHTNYTFNRFNPNPQKAIEINKQDKSTSNLNSPINSTQKVNVRKGSGGIMLPVSTVNKGLEKKKIIYEQKKIKCNSQSTNFNSTNFEKKKETIEVSPINYIKDSSLKDSKELKDNRGLKNKQIIDIQISSTIISSQITGPIKARSEAYETIQPVNKLKDLGINMQNNSNMHSISNSTKRNDQTKQSQTGLSSQTIQTSQTTSFHPLSLQSSQSHQSNQPTLTPQGNIYYIINQNENCNTHINIFGNEPKKQNFLMSSTSQGFNINTAKQKFIINKQERKKSSEVNPLMHSTQNKNSETLISNNNQQEKIPKTKIIQDNNNLMSNFHTRHVSDQHKHLGFLSSSQQNLLKDDKVGIVLNLRNKTIEASPMNISKKTASVNFNKASEKQKSPIFSKKIIGSISSNFSNQKELEKKSYLNNNSSNLQDLMKKYNQSSVNSNGSTNTKDVKKYFIKTKIG